MTRLLLFLLLTGLTPLLAQPVSLEAIKSYPFPTELTSSAQGSKIAWIFDEQGRRNICVQRLREKGVPVETFVVVDDTHHWMKWSNAVRVGLATADFFSRQLLKPVKR